MFLGLVREFSPELVWCVESSIQRLSKEHKSVFAALSVLSAACGGSFDQNLVHALLGQEQQKFSRAALHQLHSKLTIILFRILIAVSIVVVKLPRLIHVSGESIIDMNASSGTFTMHDLMLKCATALYSMAKTDLDFQQQYCKKKLHERLKDYMLGFLKAETCRVISSGSLHELNKSDAHRMLLTYLLDITIETSRAEHNILIEGRHVVRKIMAAQLRLSRYYPLLKQLLEEMTDSQTPAHACMLALCYMEISVAEMEMDDYAAARSHLEKVFHLLHVDCTLQEPPQEHNAVVAEAFLYYAVCLDNLPGDHQQTHLTLACLKLSRQIFKHLADCAEAAGDAEAQGQQVSLRSQEASVLMQMSSHLFGYWKEINSEMDCIGGSSVRNSPSTAADASAKALAAFDEALAVQHTCIKLRESLRQYDTLNMSLALLHHSNLLAAAGDIARALEAARKADGIMRALLGPDHRQALQSTMHLAKLYASELHDHR